MAENKKYIDYKASGGAKKKKKKKSGGNKISLVVAACVIITALVVSAVLFAASNATTVRIVDFGTVVKGIKVGGIDLSGMTRDQALAATADLEKSKLNSAKFTLSVNGQTYNYGAADFSIVSDYNDVIQKAINYGHTGNFDQRLKETQTAESKGVSFDITLSVDDNALKNSLNNIKTSLDKPAKDASASFMPWGYTLNADGTATAYTPDLKTIQAIVETEAHGKEYNSYPQRATTADADMPSLLRYEYYKNNTFVAGYDSKSGKFINNGYRPPNANISRFFYTQESEGLTVDLSKVGDQIKNEIKTGKYDTITVPCQVTEPTAKLADIKANTQLIVSWTSSFSMAAHYNYNRNWNVAMISALINNGGSAPTGAIGSILQPGQQWSANTIVGLRTPSTAAKIGWKQAAGIENGGYTPQYGGGVCQLGSTTYNAAIRTGLKVASFTHHTIPSDYEPAGLDATLSSPGPDLVLENDGTSPYYIVSYVNPGEKDVTVEIYGPPLTDPDHPEWGNVIYTYSSYADSAPYGPTPASKTIPEAGPDPFQCPDGTMIGTFDDTGNFVTQYQYAKDRQGSTAEVYRIILSANGNQLDKAFYMKSTYNTINGTIYLWTGPVPTPSPSPTDSEPPTQTTQSFWGPGWGNR